MQTKLLYRFMMPILVVILAGNFTSCGKGAQVEQGPDEIRQQIASYQEQINELTLAINKLDQQLAAMGEQPRSLFQLPVTVRELSTINFDQYFKATSTVEAVQAAIISPETSGQIQQILVDKGQRVNRGQIVARLNTKVMESSIEEVKTSLTLARTVYERQKSLWDQRIGSEIQFLESQNAVKSLESRLETLQSQLEMAVMRAPFNGIVDDINVKTGELAMPGTPVMNIVNLNKLYINADISESHLGSVSKGDIVILRFPAFPETEILVPVNRVGNTINPENRTFRVQLIIDNPGEQFKPNMMASMGIKTLTMPDVIAIPSILIKQDLQGHYVYLAVNENGELISHKAYIERGADGEGITMIQSGLSAGDLLIDKGHNQVIEGSRLRIEDQQELTPSL